MSSPSSSSELDADLTPGLAVGEYVIESKLGQGGFGAVYKAAHPVIGKLVAIKVLAQRYSVDPEMVERFISEARAVIQIKHRNIIDIFSFGKLSDGRRYYVMEYLDGEPLDKLLDRVHRLTLADALPILRAIGRALDAAHAKGIAHRDLKPENVFLGRDEDGNMFPKLLDFGVAKLLHPDDGVKSKTRTGVPIGTPYFMSPEQCRGRDVDHRTDFYAFGVMTYLMLTGEYPIDGDDYMTILMRQMADEPAPPSTIVPELPHEIDAIIADLMNKEPARRPVKLGAALRALEAVAERSGIAIPPSVPSDIMYSMPSSVGRPLGGEFSSAATQPAMPRAIEPITNQGARSPTPVPARRNVTPLPSEHGRVAGTPMRSITDEPVPRKRRTVTFVLGALVAIGAAVLVFQLVSSSGSSDSNGSDGSSGSSGSSGARTDGVSGSSGARTGGSSGVSGSADARTGSSGAPDVAVELPGVGGVAVSLGSSAPSVKLTVTGAPDGMQVFLGRTKLGTAPGEIEVPAKQTIVLRFEKAGFQSVTKRVVTDRTSTLDVKLRAARDPGAPKPPNDDDSRGGLLDPFGKPKK